MSIKYRKLDTARNEIRLLELLPEPTSNSPPHSLPVRCRLKHASQDDELEYSALTYAWGDPTKTARIQLVYEMGVALDGEATNNPVNSFSLQIGANLESALRHLKVGLQVPLTLWADALCIYSYRTAMKYLGNLRFMPQFSEGIHFVSERKNLRSVLSRKKPVRVLEAPLGLGCTC
jgi:Heterokaryon incompatibility protein (HET)